MKTSIRLTAKLRGRYRISHIPQDPTFIASSVINITVRILGKKPLRECNYFYKCKTVKCLSETQWIN